MLTTEATQKMIEEWKQLFESHHANMHHNRKSGTEVDADFRRKYSYQVFDNAEFQQVCKFNIMENNFIQKKLSERFSTNIRSYLVDGVLVGIDLISGEFHVESEKTEKAVPIYDDLFMFRGLDCEDLKSFFLVAQYVKLTER